MSSNQLQRAIYSHPWYYYVGLVVYHVAVALALVFVFFKISWPQHLDQARLNEIEREFGNIRLAQSGIRQRQMEANAEAVELQVGKLRRPSIQLTPVVYQSGSFQDIREIRLELTLSNVGDCGALIHGIEATVENGVAKEEASKIIVDTQNYYYDRIDYQSRGGRSDWPLPLLYESGSASPYPDRTVSGTSESGSIQEDNAVAMRGMYSYLRDRLPYHPNCPHGRLFALSEDSPDILWTRIENAKQSSEQKHSLGPQERASLNFNYLLTEFPMQHNRQWLKFNVVVEYSSEDDPSKVNKQHYTQIVSGLPGDNQALYKVAKYTEFRGDSPEPSAPTVWYPTAPLMPTTAGD